MAPERCAVFTLDSSFQASCFSPRMPCCQSPSTDIWYSCISLSSDCAINASPARFTILRSVMCSSLFVKAGLSSCVLQCGKWGTGERHCLQEVTSSRFVSPYKCGSKYGLQVLEFSLHLLVSLQDLLNRSTNASKVYSAIPLGPRWVVLIPYEPQVALSYALLIFRSGDLIYAFNGVPRNKSGHTASDVRPATS